MGKYFTKSTLILIALMMLFLSGCSSTSLDPNEKDVFDIIGGIQDKKNDDESSDLEVDNDPKEQKDVAKKSETKDKETTSSGSDKKSTENPINVAINAVITDISHENPAEPDSKELDGTAVGGDKSDKKDTTQKEPSTPQTDGQASSKTTYGAIEYVDTVIPFRDLEVVWDDNKEIGTQGILTKGQNGLERKEVRKVYLDGKYSHTETVKDTYVVKKVVHQQEWIGGKVPPDPWDEWKNASPSQISAEVVRLVNAERSKHGLAPLKTGYITPPEAGSYNMQELADIRAKEIATDYSHNSASGSKHFAEAIGKNRNMEPAMIVRMWLESAGHRKILLSPTADYIAVGFYRTNEVNHYSLLISAERG